MIIKLKKKLRVEKLLEKFCKIKKKGLQDQLIMYPNPQCSFLTKLPLFTKFSLSGGREGIIRAIFLVTNETIKFRHIGLVRGT